MFYFSVQTHTTASNSSTFISQKKFWSETGCGRSLTKTDWSELWSGCASVRFPWEREILGGGGVPLDLEGMGIPKSACSDSKEVLRWISPMTQGGRDVLC